MDKIIPIKHSFIQLGQFLKLTQNISSGGQATHFLANNLVLVNGQHETRRGRKVFVDDLVKIKQIQYKIEQRN